MILRTLLILSALFFMIWGALNLVDAARDRSDSPLSDLGNAVADVEELLPPPSYAELEASYQQAHATERDNYILRRHKKALTGRIFVIAGVIQIVIMFLMIRNARIQQRAGDTTTFTQ